MNNNIIPLDGDQNSLDYLYLLLRYIVGFSPWLGGNCDEIIFRLVILEINHDETRDPRHVIQQTKHHSLKQ